MVTKGDVLRRVMLETGTTQSVLARITGVRQPSISQFLSGKVEFSDGQLDRLLAGMGYRLEVVRRPVRPELTRSERRSWMLHRRISMHLSGESLESWVPKVEQNLTRLGQRVRGQTHLTNLERWRTLVSTRDVLGLHRAMTGLDRSAIEMREVSPLAGLLSEVERLEVMSELSAAI